MKKSIWTLKLSTAALVLIPVGVGINFIGKFLAVFLKLPLWLDSIGTILSAMLAGPIVGAIVGFINNLIVTVTTDPMAWPYALTQIAIGIVAGVLAKTGFIKDFGRVIILGLSAGFTAVLVSTPLNLRFWDGMTGNIWGDAVYTWMIKKDFPIWFSSLCDEIVIDLPDKLVVAILAFLIFKSLPKTLISMYEENKVETFNESDL
ncbi:MAG: ECF transporter S component [Lactovum sp.]